MFSERIDELSTLMSAVGVGGYDPLHAAWPIAGPPCAPLNDHLPDDAAAVTDEVCRGCGRPKARWSGNGALGVRHEGESFCCRACAVGAGCTCEARESERSHGYEDSQPANA